MNRTIYALASGAPPAGVAVIRIAGLQALPALATLLRTSAPEPRRAALRRLHHPATGQLLDTALVLTFAAPASFTGDDAAELHLHGGPAVVAGVLAALATLPHLHAAEPGEFTRRAFDNGRLDLTQVEALSDLITAETESQRDQALNNAEGALRHQLESWRSRLLDLLADAEADLDFAESEDDVQANLDRTRDTITPILHDMRAALAGHTAAREIQQGLTIAIAGPPNAGKSSLFNALLSRDAAITSPLPGTTRDTLEARLNIAGHLVTLIDTAGLRETTDPLEAEGITRAHRAADQAHLVLALSDGIHHPHQLRVRPKCDLTGHPPGSTPDGIHISSITGAGINDLRIALSQWLTTRLSEPPSLLTHERHATAIATAAHLLETAVGLDPVLRAELLHSALLEMDRLLGRTSPEELLGRIFSRFCIGK